MLIRTNYDSYKIKDVCIIMRNKNRQYILFAIRIPIFIPHSPVGILRGMEGNAVYDW